MADLIEIDIDGEADYESQASAEQDFYKCTGTLSDQFGLNKREKADDIECEID